MNEFHYVEQDWYTGKNYRISITDSVKYKEETDINKIKNNVFQTRVTKLPVDFFVNMLFLNFSHFNFWLRYRKVEK